MFLQGEDADRVLDLIDRDGVEAGIEHLSGWDYGDETTDAALENGDVHDHAPVYAGDRQAETGDYAMSYNTQAGHVALYRRHLARPEDALDPPAEPAVPARHSPTATRETTRRSGGRDNSWFGHPGVAAVKQTRGLSL